MRKLLCALLLAGTVLPAAGALTGCKQGEGEVCQIDSDCESGLTCNATTMQCQRQNTGDGDGD